MSNQSIDGDKIVDQFFSFIYAQESSDDEEDLGVDPTNIGSVGAIDSSADPNLCQTKSAAHASSSINKVKERDVKVNLLEHEQLKPKEEIVTVDKTKEDCDHLVPENVDAVLDDHFWFLKDESDEFFSLDEEELKERSYENVSIPQASIEPIYSNVGTRPKLQDKIDGLDSKYLQEPLYENLTSLKDSDCGQENIYSDGNSSVIQIDSPVKEIIPSSGKSSIYLGSDDHSSSSCHVDVTSSALNVLCDSSSVVINTEEQSPSVDMEENNSNKPSRKRETECVVVNINEQVLEQKENTSPKRAKKSDVLEAKRSLSLDLVVEDILDSGIKKDLEKLRSFDLELTQLEQIGQDLSSSQDTNATAEKSITSYSNVTSFSMEEAEGSLDSNLKESTEIKEQKMEVEQLDNASKPFQPDLRLSITRQFSFEEDTDLYRESDQTPTTPEVAEEEPKNEPPIEQRESVIRKSMKKMRHIRLSGRRSKNRSKKKLVTNTSEETEGRRQLPPVPQFGLPSVRSPTTSATLLPSLLAALTPTDSPPRETFPPPEQSDDQNDYFSIDCGSSSPPVSPQGPSWFIPEVSETTGGMETETTHLTTQSAHLVQRTNDSSRLEAPRAALTLSRSSDVLFPRTASTSPRESSLPPSLSPRQHSRSPRGSSLSPQQPSRSLRGSSLSPRQPSRSPRGSSFSPRQLSRSPREPSRSPVSISRSNLEASPSTSGTLVDQLSSSVGENPRRYSNASGTNVPNRTNSITPLISGDTRNTQVTPRATAITTRTRRSRIPEAASSPARSTTTQGRSSRSRQRISNDGFKNPVRGIWPHNHSGLMATLSVTLNVFNISRFAVLGAKFGWLFPVQWLILSLVIGLPLMTFQAAIGQATGGSVIDMWVISPIFQGVGYSLLFVEIVLGVYCCVPIAWLFTYFRDSFDMRHFRCLSVEDCKVPSNLTREINSVTTSYFSSIVLQRSDDGNDSYVDSLGSVKFDLSFNLALIWVITFLALSRGTRSYGKICYPMFLIPLCGYLALCFYLAHWTNRTLDGKELLSKFIDRQSWLVASREAFLVWGLHAAVTQQMAASHKKDHPLWRDTTCVALITALGLCLTSFCGLLCASVLDDNKISYIPSSFETAPYRDFVDVQILFKDADTIMAERDEILGKPPYLRADPAYHNFYVGIKIRDEYLMRLKPDYEATRSGYNCIRFLTELFPALLFAKEDPILNFWPPIFYLGLLLFGLAHQLSVWHSVVQGIVRLHKRLASWETFITFCLCLLGFSTSLLMATGAGINIIYFLDFAIGGLWWIMILQLIMVFAILFVRGKPFAANDLAYTLLGKCCSTAWLASPLAFSWSIMIPVGLLVLSISFFKTGNYREVFAWSSPYWSTWTCQLASTMQLFPLLVVPLVGLIQTCRFLVDPRQDLFERIQHLYRPPALNQTEEEHREYDEYDLRAPRGGNVEPDAPLPYSDPPPKYTPPPSYSTATGSGLSKLFNHSFRRLRNTLRNQSTVSTERLDSSTEEPYIPPPDYVTRHTYSPPSYATLDPLRLNRAMNVLYTDKPSSVVQLHLPHELRRRQNTCVYCNSKLRRSVNNTSPEVGSSSNTDLDSNIYGATQETFSDSEGNNSSDSCSGSCSGSSRSEKQISKGSSPCVNPSCPGPQLSFVRSDSVRGSSLSRSLRLSLRRSARRLAQAFSRQEGTVLVSHVSNNSLGPLGSSQSEA